jgi:hypothetical protein
MAVALPSLFAASAGFAEDELCKRVGAFERTPLVKLADGGFQRRWMDFSWGGSENLAQNEVQIGATLKCHGSDDVAKTLCSYALHNTPHENMTYLPMAILRCHGFVSDRATFPRRWVEELGWDTPDGLIEELQIDQLDRPDTEPSIRLTIMPFPESPRATKPSPFFEALSAKLGSDDVGD